MSKFLNCWVSIIFVAAFATAQEEPARGDKGESWVKVTTVQFDHGRTWAPRVAVSADGKNLAFLLGNSYRRVGSPEASVRVYDATTGKETLVGADRGAEAFGQIHFTSDGRRLWWDSSSGTAKSCILEAGADHESHKLNLSRLPDGNMLENSASKHLSPNGSILIDNCLVVWNTANWKQLGTLLSEKGNRVNGFLFFAHDGQRLVCTEREYERKFGGIVFGKAWTTVIWEVGEKLKRISEVDGKATAISPDGKLLVVEDGTVWDVDGKKKVASRELQKEKFSVVFISNDKRILLKKAGDPTPGILTADSRVYEYNLNDHGTTVGLVLWDAQSGKDQEIGTAEKTNRITAVNVSPDGSVVLWRDAKDTVSIWDMNKGRRIAQFVVPGCGIVEFSPDGRTVAIVNNRAVTAESRATGPTSWKWFPATTNKPLIYLYDIVSDKLAYVDVSSVSPAPESKLTLNRPVVFSQTGDRMFAIGKDSAVLVFQRRLDNMGQFPLAERNEVLHNSSSIISANKAFEGETEKGARRLVARIKSVSKSDLDQAFTQHLSNLSVSATDTKLIVSFDVDRKSWKPVTRGFSFLIRLFDEDGKYITHFVTQKDYTASPDVYAGWLTIVNRAAGLPPAARDKLLGGFTPALLEPSGNRLVFSVNPAALERAAIVQVGFLHVPKGER